MLYNRRRTRKKKRAGTKRFVQNVEYEYIRLSETVFDNFSSNTINVENTRHTNQINCNCFSPSMSTKEIQEDSVILASNNLFFDDDQNNNVVTQNVHREQEVRFEHSNLISFLPLNSPTPNFTTTNEQSTFQNNYLTGVADSIIPSLSYLSNQIEDVTLDESIQER